MRHSTATVALTLAAWLTLASGRPVEASEGYGGPYASPSLSVNDVDVETVTGWLRRFGIDVPIAVRGRASASLTVGVPIFAPGTGRAYRLDGSLTSQRLVVESIELRDVAMTLAYRDGVMRILPLSFRIVDPLAANPNATAGTFSGRATLPLIPRGRMSLGLVIGRVPVGPLARQIEGLPELESGAVSGSVWADVPLDEVTDVAAWQARGRVALEGWTMFGRTLSAASARFAVRDAELAVSQLAAQVEGIRFAGDGALKLLTPFAYSVNLAAAADELADINSLLDEPLVPDDMLGQPSVAARVDGTLDPFVYNARSTADVREFRYEGVELNGWSVTVTATPERITLGDLQVAPPTGRLETRLHAEVPTKSLAQLAAWSAELELLAENWVLVDQAIRRVEASLRLADGTVSASRLHLVTDRFELTAAGTAGMSEPFAFDGRAELRLPRLASLADLHPQLRRLRDVAGRAEIDAELSGTGQPFEYRGHADVRLADVRLRDAAAGTIALSSASLTLSADDEWLRIGNLTLVPAQGRFAGEIDARAPKDRIADPAAWEATGSIALADWPVADRVLRTAALEFQLADRQLTVPRLTAELTDASATGSVQVMLADEFDFTAALGLRIDNLASAAALVPEIELPESLAGQAELDVSATGTLRPLNVDARGRAAANDVRVDSLAIDSASADFRLDDQRLLLDDLAVRAYGGELAGTAVVPLRDAAAGRADLGWREIDLGRLVDELAELPAPLSGTARGDLALQLAPADERGRRDWSLRTTFAAAELALGPVQVGDVNGRMTREDGVLAYAAGGGLLGGRADVSGRWSAGPGRDAATDEGQLTLSGIELQRLWPILAPPGTESPLTATLDAEITYVHSNENGVPAGSGRLELVDVRWQNVLLAERLEARARVAGSEVVIDPLTGRVGGGTLRLVSRGALVPRPAQTFELTLSGGEMERLLEPWPALASRVEGRVDLVFRGVLRDGVQAEGRIVLPRSRLDGQRVSNVRVPVRLEYDPRVGTARARLSEVTAEAVGGRVSGNASMSLGRTFDVDGSAKFSDFDPESLFGEQVFLGDGRISGTIVVAGRQVRTLADIDARIEARLRRSRARSLPLVELIQPYLTSRLPAGEMVDFGELRARLRRGIVTVQRFVLDDDAFQLLATGTLVPNGRMNLDVAVHTRPTGPNRFIGQFLLDRLPPVGPVPVTIAAQANRWLSNRTVYLEVTGTLKRPVVRVQAMRMLEDEALRLFLGSLRP